MKSTRSRETLILLVAAFSALAIPIAIFMLVKFSTKPTAVEKSLLGYAPAPLSFTPRLWRETALNCPVNAGGAGYQPEAAPEHLGAVAPAPGPGTGPAPVPRLSFVLYQGSPAKDTAILDGQLVRQGSRLKQWLVLRIEQKRVQLAGKKGNQWLTME